MSLAHNEVMDAQSLLESFGYLVIFGCVFIECGVLLGLVLPLPGFSLLFTGGVLAAAGKMDETAIIIIGSLAAISGYIVGYFTGSKYGRKLFYEKSTGQYFTKQQGLATEKFMKKYGYSALILGRFLPIAHNVIPLLSGVARTPLLPFMLVNVIGGFIWVASSTLLGFYVGQSVPGAQYLIFFFVALTILFANLPFGKNLLLKITKKIENI